jgi:peptide/nickel transport system substrate-binding protein
VTYKVINNETTAANALLTGATDITVVTGQDVNRLLADPTITHFEQPTWALHMLALNEGPGKGGTNQTVRQALITAIDPNAWMQAAQGGHGRLSTSFITKDTNCFDTNTAKLAPKPSVEAARKVLTDAGWTFANGKLSKDGQPLKFTFTGGLLFNAGPEYVVNQWSQMGADVTLVNPDYTTFALGITLGKYEVSIITTSTPGPFMSPVAKRISGPTPPTGTNYTWSQDPVLNSEGGLAASTVGQESCKHWATFQEQIWKNWHLLPLAAPYTENFSRSIDMTLGVTPIMLRRVK